MPDPALDILNQYWGYTAFRPLQREIIGAVLDGQDTLALLPTGGGKSICFQVPGLLLPGLTVVVSPLIALMKDQVLNLDRRGIQAAALFSGMSRHSIIQTLDKAEYGRIKFLYVSPERLETEVFTTRLCDMALSLLVVDEAHCISQWGYDFRPPYLRIARIRELFPRVPVLALTATATPRVVEDIQEKLQFAQKRVFQQSFERQNLTYVVRRTHDKFGKLLDILHKIPGTSVVYVRNRRRTQELAARLVQAGIAADYYHAGLDPIDRDRRQSDWINNKTRVIVCTNAFGMGIDKPDVRTVIHLDLPESLEAYFQEAGRAGRDGQSAYAVLLYEAADGEQLLHHLQQSFPTLAELRKVYSAIASYTQVAVGIAPDESFDFDIAEFVKRYRFDSLKAYACLQLLEMEGWITLTDPGFIKPSIHFTATRNEVYEFMLSNKQYEKLIQALLRGYHELFTEHRPIDIAKLAQRAGLSQDDCNRQILSLHKLGLLQYRAAKTKLQLTFLRERIDSANLIIDQNLFQFRKERAHTQIRAAINYAELKICRSKQLLSYFGEHTARNCGKCDVCLDEARNKQALQPCIEAIKKLVTHVPTRMYDLPTALPHWPHEIIEEAVHTLIDEQVIIERQGLLTLL